MGWPLLGLVLSCTAIFVVAVDGDQHPPKQLPPDFVSLKQGGGFSKRMITVTCTDDHHKRTPCTVVSECPKKCERQCLVFCPTCKIICLCDLVGGMCGDPRLTGGDGNSFYFHGRKDADFCLLSDANLHINAHFIGRRNPNMTRDFTWVKAIAVRFDDHCLYIRAEKTATWDDDNAEHFFISFDGKPVDITAEASAGWVSASVPELAISRMGDNSITVELTGMFKIIANAVPITEEDSRIHNYGVTADDNLVHLDLAFKFYSLSSDVHGVLGQTYRPDYVNKLDVGVKVPVMGGASNFLTSDIFSTDCRVARFTRGSAGGTAMVAELSDVNCSSWFGGRGIVCKK
uniref:Uncharacterized protein n=1 Tax=Ananas comosus var. bracteatus TaxID=296719 RepID=A0A6V7QX06_ANACO